MKRIFYQGSFKLATDWPEEPTTHRWSPDDSDDAEYDQAVTSAMENGVRFADQERIKSWLLNTKGSWQPKDGDNWDCPENVEVGWQYKDEIKGEWCDCTGTTYQMFERSKAHPVRKVAIFKSESVEKKESRCTLSDKELVEAIHKLVTKQCKTGQGWLMTVPVDFNRDSDMLISELIKRFEVLNQSTPKE